MAKRTFVIGDIHGRIHALNNVLDKSGFDDDVDRLITLGDIVDGGENTKEVIDRLLEIKDRIDIRGNHDCLTQDAEALTQRGWLKYTDLTKDDKVYSYDTVNHIGKWMPITRIIVKEHNGNMVSVNTNRLRMMVTQKHRVLCSKRSVASKTKRIMWNEYQYIRAGELKSRIRIPSCISDNNEEFNISDDKIRMTAWILTDSNIDKRNGYVTIYQSKQKGCEKIEILLNKLGCKYTKCTRIRDIRSICGRGLTKPPLDSVEYKISANDSRRIREYVPRKGIIPWWVFKLSNRQFQIFLGTLIEGDGSVYNRGSHPSILYGTQQFLNSVQSVCVTKGYTATLVMDNRGSPRLNICSRKTIEFDCCNNFSLKSYKGTVWCIETPLTNFMVRYKGTCYFTGNSWFMGWMYSDPRLFYINYIWQENGGNTSQKSYDYDVRNIPESHKKFFENQTIYYVDNKNNIFVHGGFKPNLPIKDQDNEEIMWDRALPFYARKQPVPGYNQVFVGHTTVKWLIGNNKQVIPTRFNNLIMCDMGKYRIAMINVDNTDEYYVSKKHRGGW